MHKGCTREARDAQRRQGLFYRASNSPRAHFLRRMDSVDSVIRLPRAEGAPQEQARVPGSKVRRVLGALFAS